MTTITEAKKNIQIEEVQFGAGVNEGTWNKIGGSINFINLRQFDTKQFFINGPYSSGAGQSGLDGLMVFPFNMEVVGIYVFNLVAGTSGTTTFDIHWLNASGSDQGSIFSTKPSITSTASNNAYLSKIVATGQEASEGGTGLTLPVFSKTDFDQFDALRIDIDSAMAGAENAGLGIWIRPR